MPLEDIAKDLNFELVREGYIWKELFSSTISGAGEHPEEHAARGIASIKFVSDFFWNRVKYILYHPSCCCTG